MRYEQLGFKGNHASCSDNLSVAMRLMGYNIDVTRSRSIFDLNLEGWAVNAKDAVPSELVVELL